MVGDGIQSRGPHPKLAVLSRNPNRASREESRYLFQIGGVANVTRCNVRCCDDQDGRNRRAGPFDDGSWRSVRRMASRVGVVR
jgi:hypothetical protein